MAPGTGPGSGPIDAERWQRLSPLLDELLDAEPAHCAAVLARLRTDDPSLAVELERLLELDRSQDNLLDTPLVETQGVRAGATVGPYRLDRLLGEGGMGQVWMASRADGLYQRRVALKLLRPGLANPDLRLRFTREREILARLEHAYIARLLDAGISQDGQPYLALDYVDGEAITDWAQQRGAGVRDCLRLFLQVCEAVSHAHANLIVHRDLKPSNILVTPLDEVRLLDFGIAKLIDRNQAPEQTRPGARAFTLHYAAPEQIRGEPVSTRTDVYALGVVLYELLAGCKPYLPEHGSDAQWEQAILAADPVRPSAALQRRAGAASEDAAALRQRARAVAGDLDNIVLKALSKASERRYASVEALALDLRRYLAGRTVLARPQALSYRLGKYVRRQRWPLASAALAVAVLVSALVIVAWQGRQALREASRAQALQNFMVDLFRNAGSTPDGQPLDVRELLASGVARGEAELARQPTALAGLLGVIAQLRVSLGDLPQALALFERQAALVATLDHAPPSLQLEAASGQGQVLRLLLEPDGCIARMQPQQALARRQEHRLPLQVAGYWSQLGRCHRAIGQHDQARLLFHRALDLRRDILQDPAGVAESEADLAGLAADAGDHAEAMHRLDLAMTQLQAAGSGRNPLAVEIQRSACALERAHGDLEAAAHACGRAMDLATSVHGPQHRITVAVQREQAGLNIERGRLAEAEAGLRGAHGWMVSRLGPQHPEVAANLHRLALLARERDTYPQALRDLRSAIGIWRAADDRRQLTAGRIDLAMLQLETDAPRQALATIDGVLQPGASLPPALHARALWLRGRIQLALGETTAAESTLAGAIQAAGPADMPHGPDVLRAQLALASLQAMRGDGAAREQLHTLATPAGDSDELRQIAWLARGHAAAADCLGDDPEQAAIALQALEDAIRAAQPEGGSTMREIQSLRRSCTGADTAAPRARAAS